MSRVQLALNVADLDQAIGFYTKLFGTAPAKVRPGYANFAVADPPLKLILIAGNGEPGALKHLGARSDRRTRWRRRSSGWPTRGPRPSRRTRSPVATRCRTRCGWTHPTESRGRSTPCSPSSRCPAASFAQSSPRATRCAASQLPNRRRAAADVELVGVPEPAA